MQLAKGGRAGQGRAGQGRAGLGWAGLGWAGLGWAGLGWAGQGRQGSFQVLYRNVTQLKTQVICPRCFQPVLDSRLSQINFCHHSHCTLPTRVHMPACQFD